MLIELLWIQVIALCPDPFNICVGCAKPYSFNSFECVASCPEGSVFSGTICLNPTSAYFLFDVDLSQDIPFTSSIVGNFRTTKSSFKSVDSPVPTKERGLYFYPQTNLLLMASPVPAPSLTLHIWARILSSGTIYKISGVSDFLDFSGMFSFNIDYRMCRPVNDCSMNLGAAVFPGSGLTSLWVYLKLITIVNKEGEINFKFCKNYECTTITLIGENALITANEAFTWTVGDSDTGFEGFVYWIAGYNNVHSSDLKFVNPPICNPFEYYENFQCYPCPGSCDLSPLWCVRGIDCSYCINNYCTGCNGYTSARCYASINLCPATCAKCAGVIQCTECIPNYILLNRYHWGVQCSGYLRIPLTSTIFESFLQSGSNPSTTNVLNPESDDPIPSPCRGYYFSAGKYLMLTPNSVFPTNMVLYMWVFPISGTILSKGNRISIGATSSSFILTSQDGTATETIDYGSTDLNTWQYIGFKLEYLSFITSMTVYHNSLQTPIQSSYGYFYQDSISDNFIIGTDFTQHFSGFLAIVGVGSYSISPSYSDPKFGFEFNTYCGDTLNPCIDQPCDVADCSLTCGKCDRCADNAASPATCYTCNYGYYSSSSTQAALIVDGLINVGGVGFPEKGTCLSGVKGYGCTSCNPGYFLYENVCISACPNTFAAVSGVCNVVDPTYLVASVKFSNIILLSNYSGFNIGNNHTNSYPNFDPNDPIPAYNRGYYFNSNSYMSHDSITLGPDLALAFWIKFVSPGIICLKQTGLAGNYIVMAYINENFQFNLTTAFGSHSAKKVFVSASLWTYYQSGIYFDPIEFSSRILLGINKDSGFSIDSQNLVFDDQPPSTLTIGSNNGQGFSGFLYSIEVYILNVRIFFLYSTTCAYGTICPSSTTVLLECDLNKYWDGTDCIPCKGCRYGCVRGTDCSLCADPICVSCSSFDSACSICTENSKLVGNVCQCDPGFNQTTAGDCVVCDASCGSCNGNLTTDCLTCSSGYLWFVDYARCLKALKCPTLPSGMSNTVAACSTSVLKVFSAVLNKLTDNFVDDANGILISTGADTNFFTNYSLTDPWVTYKRGFYFTGSSYLSIDPHGNTLVLAPEFTIGIWALVIKGGTIFMRRDASIIVSITTSNGFMSELRSSTNTFTKSAQLNQTLNVWHLFEIQVSLVSSHSVLTIRLDSTISAAVSLDSQFQDSINSVSTYLGSDQGNAGFKGFVYSTEIYNSVVNILTSNDGCLKPADVAGCLSTCLIDEYPPYCFKCRSDCKYGCLGPITCSICNDPLCEACNPLNNCTSCIAGAVKTDKGCTCLTNYNQTSHSCDPPIVCYVNCGKCANSTMSGCLQCSDGYYMISGYCMLCPTGYRVSTNGSCDPIESLVFDVNFNILDGIIYDKVNSIPVLTGKSQTFYPEFDSEDPYPSYLRGFYFNGISSIVKLPSYKSWTSPSLILAPSFTIQIWIKPQSSSGCILSSMASNETQLSLCYSPSEYSIQANIGTQGATISTFPYSVSLNFWQTISVSLDNNNSNTVFIYMNANLAGFNTLNGSVYPNYLPNTSIIFGSFQKIYFTGFIYQIYIFNSLAEASIKFQIFNCPVSLNGKCLVECLFNEFWVGPELDDCSPCHEACELGCRRNDSCSLCDDPLCRSCSYYNATSCKDCVENAAGDQKCQCLKPSQLDYSLYTCKICEENQFYNNFTCEYCSGLCKTCTAEECLSCVDNSVLDKKTCICLPEFKGINECVPAYYDFFLRINENNAVVYIDFDEGLMNELQAYQIDIDSTCGLDISFGVYKWNELRYQIDLGIQNEITYGCKLSICFKQTSPVVSISNKTLSDSCKSIDLNPKFSKSDELLTNSSQQTSERITYSITAVSVSVGFLSLNPMTLWSSINTIQMLCYIALTNIDQPARFKGYLKGLRKYNLFPNVFEYFVPHIGGQKPFQKAYEFGYKDNLILFNIGNYIGAFISMLVTWLIVFMLSKLTNFKPFSIGFIKNQISNTLKNYKYDAFIRFWITCYLEAFCSAIIAVITAPSYFWASMLNFLLGLLLLVNNIQTVVIGTPFLVFYFTYKNRDKITQSSEISANWGTLFYEFNNDKGLGSSQFYFFFFLRRILYILIQVFLQDVPIMQVTLNIILSIGVIYIKNLSYLLISWPFSERILNISNSLSEVGVSLIFLMLLLNLIPVDTEVAKNYDLGLVAIVTGIMGIQMVASLAVFVKTIIQILKQRKARKVFSVQSVTDSQAKETHGLDVKEI